MRSRVRSLAALAALVPLLASSVARAETCNRPDLKDTMPPDGATGVPTNASLHARYATSAEYLGEEIVLERVSNGELQTFEGANVSWTSVEGVLSITPEGGLVPGELYRLSWPSLRGIATASKGTSKQIEFEAGTIEDVELPLFDGASGLEWDVLRETDPCTDAQEERYVFDLELPGAEDDGGRDSLTLLVFQTRGPDVDPGAPKPVSVGRLPAAGRSVRIPQPIDRGIGQMCFAAVVRDLTGKVSGGGNREQCVETVEPPFFYGCAIARPRGGSPASAIAASLLALWLVRRRRNATRCLGSG